jgi:hypothetical protein
MTRAVAGGSPRNVKQDESLLAELVGPVCGALPGVARNLNRPAKQRESAAETALRVHTFQFQASAGLISTSVS